jgi:hypothetical protein
VNIDTSEKTDRIVYDILAERKRQDKLWGPFAGFDDDPANVKSAILMKKVADYAVAVAQEKNYFAHLNVRNPRRELIEIAAVAVALLEEMYPD